MGRLVSICIATLSALICAGSIYAHHSISMFEIAAPIWVKGKVVSYEPINPHARIVLEETTSDGIDRTWLIEGPTLRRLGLMNVERDFIQPGDVIEICGFPPKTEFSSERPSPETVGYPSQAFHGHVLRLPGGQMQHWGPYGKIENCISPDDEAQTWADFLNTDPMARAAWCLSPTFVWAASLPAREFVDEVSSLMVNPCE